MKYMNRVTTLTSGGHRIAPVAVLYHVEAEWAGNCMFTQKPARKLAELQIEFDCIPADVFAEPEHYQTKIGSTLHVNTQEYRALVVPCAEYVTRAFAEAAQTYTGTVTVPTTGCCYGYDAWKNECCEVDAQACEEGTRLSMTLEPKKSLIVLFDDADSALLREPLVCCGERTELTHWKRSVCEAIAYPDFAEEKEVTLPDRLAQEQPAFSDFVRYESSFWVNGGSMTGEQTALELTDASEGVEVFINGKSAGIQIVPPYLYDLTEYVQAGENCEGVGRGIYPLYSLYQG